MAADQEWAVPGYTWVRELGAGATGRVVLATHDGSGAPVAIRYLAPALLGDAEFAARFRNEARRLGGLSDPNVARFHAFVEDPRGAAVITEVVDGVTLRRVLENGHPLRAEAAMVLLKVSLLGLAAAHEVGVVHRDFKPENVLVDGAGNAKITDFGLAVRAGEAAYRAPELWAGEPVTAAADVYAATAVFYECLTGARPYQGTAEEHRHAPIPLDVVPEPLRLMIAHGMAKDPGARPSSASALLRELHMMALPVYGPEWEHTGRKRLAELAGFLDALFPLAGLPDTLGAAQQQPTPAPATLTQGPGVRPSPVQPTAEPHAAEAVEPQAGGASSVRQRDGLLRPRILVPAVIAVVVLLAIGTAAVVFRRGTQNPMEGGAESDAAPALPASPPADPGRAATVMLRQMDREKTATFTYMQTACCGNAVRVSGGRVDVLGDGELQTPRMVNPSKVPGGPMHAPAHVVLSGDRAYVKLKSAWKSYPRRDVADGKLGTAHAPQVDYARAALDVVSAARLRDLAAILAEAGPAKATRPDGLIQYRGKVRAGKALVKRLGISPDFNMPVVYTYRLRLGSDYLPRVITLKATLAAGTSSATSTTHKLTYRNWGTTPPVKPPA